MIDREHALPLTRQATLLKLSRGSLYYQARPVSPADLAIMRRIDELYLDYPFAGSRMLRDLLRGEGVAIGRGRVATMMKRMAIEALPPPEHLEAGTGPQDLPVPAARNNGRAAESGLGDGHHPHPDGARLRLSRRRGRLVQPPGPWPGGSRSRWRWSSASRRSRRRWRSTAGRRFSTRTKATNSPAPTSPASFWGRPSPSAWTARDRGGTTCSSSGCGARSNTRKSISGPTTASAKPALRSADIWTSTTVSARIRALTPGRRITPTSTTCRRSRQHEFRRRFRDVTLVGLRPPGVPPRKRR